MWFTQRHRWNNLWQQPIHYSPRPILGRRAAVKSSVRRVKWKHSRVSGALFLAPPERIADTSTCPVCLLPVNKTTRSCGENYPLLISMSEIISARTAMQEIVSILFREGGRGCSAVIIVDVNLVKGKPWAKPKVNHPCSIMGTIQIFPVDNCCL